jgi:hypothetical protein
MVTSLLARRLVEPDHWTCPHGVRTRPVHTFGPAVADVCAAAGLAPDPQQELGLDLVFAIEPDGSPSCFEFCIICARQNMKTGLLLMVAIGWLFVLDEPQVMWSSHEMSTSRDSQSELEHLIKGTPALSKHLPSTHNRGIYDARGEERIELVDKLGEVNRTVWFKARTRDGSRGLSRRKLILDEAFALKAAAVGALIPTTLAKRHAQVLYASSAGKADSDVLIDVRDRGRGSMSPRLSYLEWLCEREACRTGFHEGAQENLECDHPKDALARGIDCALDREHLLRKANPAVSTGRITIQGLRDARQAMPPAEYMRECLGWWDDPDDEINNIFGPGRWRACHTELPFPQKPEAIGFAVSHDRLHASIAVAGFVDVPVGDDLDDEEPETEQRTLVAAAAYFDDVDEARREAARMQVQYDCLLVIDEEGPAGEDIEDIESIEVELEDGETGEAAVEPIEIDDYVKACKKLFDDVRAGTMLHPSSSRLDDAVKHADWRYVAERGRVWGRRKSTGDISMLEAATLAKLGAEDLGAFTIH